MAWSWSNNLLMDQLHAGWHKNNCFVCRRNSWGVCLQGGILLLLLWSLDGWTHRRTQWEWLLFTGVCRWHCYPHKRKIPKHHLRASTGCFEYGTTLVWQDSAAYQSITQVGISIFFLTVRQPSRALTVSR
jgi:hypothetical protein